MKKVHGYTLLETDKEIAQEVKCSHKRVELLKEVLINPKGEFIVSHGTAPLHENIVVAEECTKCGFLREYSNA